VTPASSTILRPWALLCARIVLGLIFGMAGYWKCFELTPVGHFQTYFLPFADTWLPLWLLWTVGLTVPIVELVAGWLLVVGFRIRESLVGLGLVLIVVTYGHLLEDALYDLTNHVIPRLALLMVVALLGSDDRFSIDAWLHARKKPTA
jgi:uncharacterized membrane protein YphA (DoxX/SURF4 family)